MDELSIIASEGRRGHATVANPRGNRVRALFQPLLVHQRILRQIVEHRLGDWLGVALLDLRDPKAVRERALARHQRLPRRGALHAWDDELCHALDGKADEKTLSILLAIMLDGFPRGMTPNVNAYVAAALLVIGGRALSPEILAAAIVRIWRKNKFPPAISELLDECEEATQAATNARRVVTKMLALLDNAEDALIATGGFDEASASFQP
jgi:hypothetical protein